VKNTEICEGLVELIEEDGITGFQLRDILRGNYSFESLRDAILSRQELNKERRVRTEDPRIIADEADENELREETEEEKLERWSYPEYDIHQLLEEVDAKAAIAKLSELKIDDESFWQLSEDEFKDKLEITVFGTLRLLTLRIAEIKEDHKKTMEKRDKDKKKLSESDKKNVQALLSNASQSTSDSDGRLRESA